MTPERWARLKPLYNAALDLSPEQRALFVEQLRAQDASLGANLHALLLSTEASADMLDTPVGRLSSLFATPPSLLLPGTRLGGRFRIMRHLGSGGMGDVYEAADEQMEGGRIALKTVRAALAADPAVLARFKEEVRHARRVSGPNVCRIHELYLVHPEDACNCSAFLTMELLEGVTLHDRMAAQGALRLPAMQAIAEQLCTALCCIHASGVVHGDLKPRNIMLVPHGETERVVVTDFGLARAVAGIGLSEEEAEQDQRVAGTPSYMAPEQFEGRELTPATDVYALGVVLYEMCTGLQPYAAHTPLAAAIRRSKTPVHPSAVRTDLPVGWDDVIARCLRFEPDQRFGSAEDVQQQLRHPGKVSLPLGRTRRVTLPLPVLWATIAGVAAWLCIVTWIVFLRPRHRELAPDAAHWYALGMTALREGSYLKATRLLTLVTQRDPTYALAHAALADAWTELDFTGAAQHEMLLAASPAEQRGLDDTERRYIDAVRSTLIRDYSAAAQDYEAILQRLPDSAKAQGYVDLGRIYEKAGKVSQTLASYEHAAALNPDDPAPFLHLGILRSRQRDVTGADRAFREAERLYNAETNMEGLAEVSYQKGYAANDAYDYPRAEGQLKRSLAIARQIPSTQLEVRSLSQLSSVAYNDSKDDDAIAYAHQVIDTSREHGLEYWVVDGLVRLGNAYLDKADYVSAETALQEALHRAEESNHPRLRATAGLTLASVRSQQHRWDDVTHYAGPALRYFQDYGFAVLSDQALLLIARAAQGRGDYASALNTGMNLLGNAEASRSGAYILSAEECVGGTFFRLHRFPDALRHFDHALQQAGLLGEDTMYVQLDRADLLWQMGRYDEAEAALQSLPSDARKRADIANAILSIQANMLASRGRFAEALRLTERQQREQRARGNAAQADDSRQRAIAVSQLALGQLAKAKQSLRPVDVGDTDAWESAQNELTRATVLLALHDSSGAKLSALRAESFFAANHIPDSQAFALLVAAQAATLSRESANADIWSKKSVDILQGLEQSWEGHTLQLYFTRPDRRRLLRTLADLRLSFGDRLDAVLSQYL